MVQYPLSWFSCRGVLLSNSKEDDCAAEIFTICALWVLLWSCWHYYLLCHDSSVPLNLKKEIGAVVAVVQKGLENPALNWHVSAMLILGFKCSERPWEYLLFCSVIHLCLWHSSSLCNRNAYIYIYIYIYICVCVCVCK